VKQRRREDSASNESIIDTAPSRIQCNEKKHQGYSNVVGAEFGIVLREAQVVVVGPVLQRVDRYHQRTVEHQGYSAVVGVEFGTVLGSAVEKTAQAHQTKASGVHRVESTAHREKASNVQRTRDYSASKEIIRGTAHRKYTHA
jgi:uncharacterized protein (DUF3084 family)